MANNCSYQMKVKGAKNELDTFYKRMTDYNEPEHLWRIFSASIYDEAEGEIYVEGDCAWSIESCCRSGYTEHDLLESNSRQLNLEIEVWSEEPGIGFQEHYVYKKGECIKDESVDYYEYNWDKTEYPTFEEYNNDIFDGNCPVDESDFDEDGYATDGGFEGFCEYWSI